MIDRKMRDTNGMEKEQIKLPSSNFVKTWPVARVSEWLEQNEFEEFIDSFRVRQIDGAALLELTQDRLLVEFTEQKMAKRRQLAKCVTECKVQATQAKRQIARCINECKDQASVAKNAVNRIRKRQRKMDDGDGCGEQDDSDNEWDTDFEEEDEEEHGQYQVSTDTSSNGVTLEQDDELQESNCDATESSPGTFRNVWSPQNVTQPNVEPDKIVLRKMTAISLEDQPVRTPIPKPPNTKLKVEPFSIPRKPNTHPRQRPPSQPPPPPSPDKIDDDCDDEYEVPNTGIPSGFRAAKPLPVPPVPVSITLKTQHSQDLDDTYEIMDAPEETYEAVDDTESQIVKEVKLVQVDAPPLPLKSVPTAVLPPPPLPSKSKQIPQSENRKSIATSLVGKLAKDLDEKLKGNRFPIQTPGGYVPKLERKPVLEEMPELTMEIPSQEVPEPASKNFGAVRRTPPPVHVVKPIVQQNQPGLGTGRRLTNRPLPPVPICNNSEEEKLSSLPFFHEIERYEAETLIEQMASDGSFLIRPSKRAGEHNPYTITMMHDSMIFHINIRRRHDGLFALGREKPQEQTFCDLISMVTYHKSCPIILTLRGELSGKQYLKEAPKKPA